MGDEMNGWTMPKGREVSAVKAELMEHAVTVGQLREKLLEFDQAAYVVMVKDSEGNGFSPLSSAAWGWYEPESTWAGEQVGVDPDGGEPDYDPANDPDVLPVVFLDPVN